MLFDTALITTIASGALVAAASGAVGAFLIIRRMALMSDALSHVALPGIAIGILFGFDPLIGGIAFLILGIGTLWNIEQRTRLATESVTGVIFVVALAVGAVLIPEHELLETFFGSIETASFTRLAMQAVLATLTLFIALRMTKRIALASVAPDLAAASGISPARTDLILLSLIALTIAIGVSFVGVLLMSALSIIPAATARNIAKTFHGFFLSSIAIAVLSLIGGIFLSTALGITSGIGTVFVGAFFFAVSLLLKK